MDTWPAVAEERLVLAEVLDGLTPEQWETPSLCGGWTARGVATHLLLPLVSGAWGFVPDLVRARGSFDRASELGVARALAQMTTAQVVAGLRAQAENRFRPPTMPSSAPLTEVLVHGQDILVPLGIDSRRPAERWEVALGFLTSTAARRGYVRGRLPAVRLVATETEWTHGSGPEVDGPIRALGLTLAGRDARLGELSGPGLPLLAEWVRR